MGQDLIYDFLRKEMITGNQKFWKPEEIRRAVANQAIEGVGTRSSTISRQLRKLYAHGFLDIAFINADCMRPMYRLKQKYCRIESPQQVSVWFQE